MSSVRREQTGFGFPLMDRGFPMGAIAYVRNDTPTLIKASVYQIVMTTPGERWWQPEWGCRAKLLLFENATNTIKETMRSLIYEALTKWEPRILISPEDILVEESYEPSVNMQVTISYYLRETGFENAQQTLSVNY